MSDAARAEAERIMAEAREVIGLTVREQTRYIEGFVAGAHWQASQPVGVTSEMVEAGAQMLFAEELGYDMSDDEDREGLLAQWDEMDPDERKMRVAQFRAALSAALNTNGESDE